MKTNLRPIVEANSTREDNLLYVVSEGQPLPPQFTALVTMDRVVGDSTYTAERSIVRIAGGCKKFSPELKQGFMPAFLNAFNTTDGIGYRGTVFSGGTANLDQDGLIDDSMVTNVPARLANIYPCVAISTTPKTADLGMARDTGGLIVDAYGGRMDFRQTASVIYQKDPANALGWDGDLDLYLTFMEGLKMVGFNTAVIALNGGAVTRNEIYQSLLRGIAVIAVEGSLRETDAFISAFRDGDWSFTGLEEREKLAGQGKCTASVDEMIAARKADLERIDRSLIKIVPVNDAGALNEALLSIGFLQSV
ncbi:hypothetical protein GC174_15100 [bacterium]|nr:hypothetical protein [bacterium]